MTVLYQVDLPYACYGVIVDSGTVTVVEAANIASWMVGKRWPEVERWVRRKGGKITPTPDAPCPPAEKIFVE